MLNLKRLISINHSSLKYTNFFSFIEILIKIICSPNFWYILRKSNYAFYLCWKQNNTPSMVTERSIITSVKMILIDNAFISLHFCYQLISRVGNWCNCRKLFTKLLDSCNTIKERFYHILLFFSFICSVRRLSILYASSVLDILWLWWYYN